MSQFFACCTLLTSYFNFQETHPIKFITEQQSLTFWAIWLRYLVPLLSELQIIKLLTVFIDSIPTNWNYQIIRKNICNDEIKGRLLELDKL